MNNDITNSIFNESYMVADDGEVSDDSSIDYNIKTGLLREQDRFLPICNIVKIMKKAIPDNGKIAKDARECIQECVSEFISFITSEAIDRSSSENRKTVNGDDLLYAMTTLGFDNYVEPLKIYLHKYRESTKSDRNLVYSAPGYFEDSSSNEFKAETNDVVSDILRSHSSDESLLYYQPNQSGNFNL